MKKLILTALAALTVSAPAMADKWSVITGDDENTILYLNRSSFRSSGDNKTCWFALVRTKNDKAWDFVAIKPRINCGEATVTQLAEYAYKDGIIIYSNHVPKMPEAPAPGSVLEEGMRAACSPPDDFDFKVEEVSSPSELVSRAAELIRQLTENQQ